MKKGILIVCCVSAALFATTLWAAKAGAPEIEVRETIENSLQQRMVRLTRYDGQRITGISASSTFDVQLIQSDQTKVVAEISEELESQLELSLGSDGIVHVGLRSLGRNNRINRNAILKLTVFLPELTYLKASGAVTVRTSGAFSAPKTELLFSGAAELKSLDLQTGTLKIHSSGATEVSLSGSATSANVQVSGASEVDLNLTCERITVNCSGASEVDLVGTAGEGSMNVSGGSDLDAVGFAVGRLDVTASGASNAKVWAVDKLKARASGGSSIRYKGAPGVLDTQSSSASSVRKMNQ